MKSIFEKISSTQQKQVVEDKKEKEFSQEILDDLLNYMDAVAIKDKNISELLDSPEEITREEAEYFTKKYLECANQIEEAELIAKDYLKKQEDRINDWLGVIKSENQYFLELYGNALKIYAENELKDSNKKSLKLIEGTLSFRKSQDKYEYDEELLRECLNKNSINDFYEAVPPKIKKSDLKKTGKVINNKLYVNDVLIEGVTITPQDTVFSIK